MPRQPHHNTRRARSLSHEFLLSTVDRLSQEKSELLEEVRQLRAAVSVYRRIAEQVTAMHLLPGRKAGAA